MDAILRYIQMQLVEWILCSIKISLRFIPKENLKGPIDKLASLRIMAWRRIGDKSLSDPVITQFTDAHESPNEISDIVAAYRRRTHKETLRLPTILKIKHDL